MSDVESETVTDVQQEEDQQQQHQQAEPNGSKEFVHKKLTEVQLRTSRIIDRKIIKSQLCYCFQLVSGKQTWQPALELVDLPTAEQMIWKYEDEQKLARQGDPLDGKPKFDFNNPELIAHNQKLLDNNEIDKFMAYDAETERFVVQFVNEEIIFITKQQFYALPMEKQLLGYKVIRDHFVTT